MKINKMKIASSMMTISTIAMATNVALAGHSKVPSKVFDAVSRILGGISTVGIIVAAGMIIYAGFKFLTAGAGEKAKAKDMLVPMAVGGILVAFAGPIAGWIWNMVAGSDVSYASRIAG